MGCKHKTLYDHTLPLRVDGCMVWVCSACGKEGPWADAWEYWGNIECKRCWLAQIDLVACSPACAKKLRFSELSPTVKRKTSSGHYIASSIAGLMP